MKAAICSEYGSPELVQIQEVEKPAPGDGEVLIRVKAASLNPLDWHLKRGKPIVGRLMTGLRRPNDVRMGVDMAGEVVAAGSNASGLRPGDAVFGSCHGALAEYACAPASAVALKPDGVTFEQAACAPVAGYTALQGLRDKGRVQPGQKILINGAAGGVGTFAVQVGKWLGAEVTGVCSVRNADLLRKIGADRVVDYTREDFTASGQRYDLILDLVANHSLAKCRRALMPKGTYVLAGVLSGRWGAFLATIMQVMALSAFAEQRLLIVGAKRSKDDLNVIGELMASARVTPVIDTAYELGDAARAIHHLEEGHARGKIVIRVAGEGR